MLTLFSNGMRVQEFETWEDLFAHVRELLGKPVPSGMKLLFKRGLTVRIGGENYKCLPDTNQEPEFAEFASVGVEYV